MRPMIVLGIVLLSLPEALAGAADTSCRLPKPESLGASHKLYHGVFVPPDTAVLFSVADGVVYEVRPGAAGASCRVLRRSRPGEMKHVGPAAAARDEEGTLHVTWIESVDGENHSLALLRAPSSGSIDHVTLKTAHASALRGTLESGIRLHVLGSDDDLIFYADAGESRFDWMNLSQLPFTKLCALRHADGQVLYDRVLSDRGRYGVGPYDATLRPDGSFDLAWAARSSFKEAYAVFVQSFSTAAEPVGKKKKVATIEQPGREWQEGSLPSLDLDWVGEGTIQAAADTGGSSLPVRRLDARGEVLDSFLLGDFRPWGLEGCARDGAECFQRFFDSRDPKKDVLRRRRLSKDGAFADQEVVFAKNVLLHNRVLLLEQEPDRCYGWLQVSRGTWRLESRCFQETAGP